ncbi:hypothetical protein HPB48_021973 [Haemaphysalis longicornis]|uniref:Nucleic-acid-binding protein from transposon X-element n=1 Tax=Haemaphysalis longicornis TaxID=44386 RepID=A0A9J6G8N6_HAELO|nr:hypothetical protein HPB48_021973 [Haemaphysalis longicornis]
MGDQYPVLRDIDLPGTETEIMELIETPITILRATLRGSSMFLTFQGPKAPNTVYIRGVRVRVQRLDPRPVQCERCGRYNHLTSACRGGPRCGNCGGSHLTPSCTEHTQKCANCGGNHHFLSPKCRLWRRERAIAARAASEKLPLGEARRQYFAPNNHRRTQPAADTLYVAIAILPHGDC